VKKKIIISSVIISATFCFAFDFGSITKDVVNRLSDNGQKQPQDAHLSSLSQETVSNGLKKALQIGVDYAIENLGAQNGYLNNPVVKIPLPQNLQKIEGVVRKAGGDKIADDLINSMNKAASNAAPKTAKIFLDAIDKMSLEDAKKILAGDEHSATNYFKENTNEALTQMIKPIILESMEDNSVSKYYNTFNSYYKQYAQEYIQNSSVMNAAKSFGANKYIPNASDENLEDYVTNKAIDGLFVMIAQKEASIRKNPVEQTTSLLKKVFGQ
jgi:hypothetical protein